MLLSVTEAFGAAILLVGDFQPVFFADHFIGSKNAGPLND
jgi:hypothetical protein